MAAAMLFVPLETGLAGELDQRAQAQKASPSAPTRILERTQDTGRSAVKPLALPAALAHWIDENRSSRIAIGVTITR